MNLTLVLLKLDLSIFENTVDPDQMASKEAIWSGSTLFSTLIENTCLHVDGTEFGEECST